MWSLIQPSNLYLLGSIHEFPLLGYFYLLSIPAHLFSRTHGYSFSRLSLWVTQTNPEYHPLLCATPSPTSTFFHRCCPRPCLPPTHWGLSCDNCCAPRGRISLWEWQLGKLISSWTSCWKNEVGHDRSFCSYYVRPFHLHSLKYFLSGALQKRFGKDKFC